MITHRPWAWAATALRTETLTIGSGSSASSDPSGRLSSWARRSSRVAPGTSCTAINVVTTPMSLSSTAGEKNVLGVGSSSSAGPSTMPTNVASKL